MTDHPCHDATTHPNGDVIVMRNIGCPHSDDEIIREFRAAQGGAQ